MLLEEYHGILLGMLLDFKEVCEKNHIDFYLSGGTALGAIRHSGFIPWDPDADLVLPRDSFDRLKTVVEKDLPSCYQLVLGPTGGKYDLVRNDISVEVVYENGEKSGLIHPYIDLFPMDGIPSNIILQKNRMLLIYFARLGVKMADIQKCHVGNDRYAWKNVLIKTCQALHTEKWTSSTLPQKFWRYLARKNSFKTSDWVFVAYGVYGFKEIMPKEWIGEGKTVLFEGEEFKVFQEYDKYLTQFYGDYMTPKKVVVR